MRIKDLPDSPTLLGSEFLAVDSNNGTKKATVDDVLGGLDDAIQDLQDAVSGLETDTAAFQPVRINIATFSSLPQTVSSADINADMVVLGSWLSNPDAQVGLWTVTTSEGAVVVSGTISGSTALTLILGKANV